jgi:hypothetical protein
MVLIRNTLRPLLTRLVTLEIMPNMPPFLILEPPPRVIRLFILMSFPPSLACTALQYSLAIRQPLSRHIGIHVLIFVPVHFIQFRSRTRTGHGHTLGKKWGAS